MRLNKTLLTFILYLFTSPLQAQLVFDTTSNVEQMVRTIFQSEGVEIKNICFNGYSKAIRTFHNSNNSMPMQAGIFLATGHVNTAKGPNFSASTSYSTESAGDRQLTELAGYRTYDAAILEFDFIPSGNTVSFQYLFASEEFPEYVGSRFNDVFAFFISGPGIKGYKNMAVVPGTRKPVTINNINHKTHQQFYIDHPFRFYDPFTMEPDSNEVQFDGFTTILPANARVIAGQTYHLKIAIADVKDRNYDSGVFLEYGSFKSTGIPAPPSQKNKQHQDENIIILSPRRLSPEPPGHAARIIFEDTVVLHHSGNAAFMSRLEKLLPLFNNYPEATFEIYCGTATAEKDSFVLFFLNFMEENGIAQSRTEVIKFPPAHTRKNKKPEPVSQRVLLTIKQKSRQSED